MLKISKYDNYDVYDYYGGQIEITNCIGEEEICDMRSIGPIVQIIRTKNDFLNELLHKYNNKFIIQGHSCIEISCVGSGRDINLYLDYDRIIVDIQIRRGDVSYQDELPYSYISKNLFDVMMTSELMDESEIPPYIDEEKEIIIYLFCGLPIIKSIFIKTTTYRIFIPYLYITSSADNLIPTTERCINITKDLIPQIELIDDKINSGHILREKFYQLYNRNTKSARKV